MRESDRGHGCPPRHTKHGWCTGGCNLCRRHCDCALSEDELEDEAGHDSESDAGFLSSDASEAEADYVDPPELISANRLLKDALDLRLPASARRAARRSNASRQAPDIRALPRRTVAYLLHVVVAIVLRLLQLWAPNDQPGLYMLLRKRLDAHFLVQAEQDAFRRSRVCESATLLARELPRKSHERRAVLAVFAGAGKLFIETLLRRVHGSAASADSSNEDASGSEADSVQSDAPSRGGRTGTQWTRRVARHDFRRMAVGQTLGSKPRSRTSRADAAVQGVLDFLFRADNTTTLSWGTTRLRVAGKVEIIQARNRLRSRNRLWAAYDAEMRAAGVADRDRVQRSTFFQLAGAVTARDLKVGLAAPPCEWRECSNVREACTRRPVARAIPSFWSLACRILPSCGSWCGRGPLPAQCWNVWQPLKASSSLATAVTCIRCVLVLFYSRTPSHGLVRRRWRRPRPPLQLGTVARTARRMRCSASPSPRPRKPNLLPAKPQPQQPSPRS